MVETVNGSRADEALHASEEKYRIEQGLVIGQVILNDAGEGVDYRILETNAQFERLMGLRREACLSGKSFRELIPIVDDRWLRLLGRVAISSEPARFEMYAVTRDRWFDVHAFRVGDPSLRHVACFYSDISQQHRIIRLRRIARKFSSFC